jgi:hypothetical protein
MVGASYNFLGISKSLQGYKGPFFVEVNAATAVGGFLDFNRISLKIGVNLL